MANVIPFAFRGELFTGTHNFASGGDSFKLALYTSNPYDTSSTVYSATSEVSASGGSNYTAAGNALTGNAVVAATAVASCDFADTTWTSATITARGALIYNNTKSNASIAVLDFGSDFTSTAGTFTVQFPAVTDTQAILRIA